MKKKFWLGTFVLATVLCWGVGVANINYTASADGGDSSTETPIEQNSFELLNSTASYETHPELSYDIATGMGSMATTGFVNRYFTHKTSDYVVDSENNIKPFSTCTQAVYSVTFTNLSTTETNAANAYLGIVMKADNVEKDFRVYSALQFGNAAYMNLGTGETTPFDSPNKSSTSGAWRGGTTVLDATSTTITATVTLKVGDVDGSIAFTVNGNDSGTIIYKGTTFPKMGLMGCKYAGEISNASYKVLGMSNWYEGYDLLSYDKASPTVESDGSTAEEDFSYDFTNKVGYIGGSASGVSVATGERATAYFNMSTPDKVIAIDDALVDYLSVEPVTFSMTYSDVVAADGAFDATDNNEAVGLRLNVPETGEIAAIWVAPGAIYGNYGVVERTDRNNTVFEKNETSSEAIRFGGNVSPWTNGSLDITLKMVPAKDDVDGSIEIYLNGVSQKTISYSCEELPDVAMYSRGVSAKATNASYVLSGIKAIHEHTEETVLGYEKTCTQDGLTNGVKCSVCEMTLVEQEAIPAGHETEHTSAVEATCTQDGNVEYWECIVCDKIFADENCTSELNDVVDVAEGHNAVFTPAKETTCTEDGNVEHWYCDKCETAYEEEACITKINNAINASEGHSTTHIEETAASCTQDGNVEYWRCGACGKTFADEACTTELGANELNISKVGHTAGDWIVDEPAQVGVNGSKHKECTVCGDTVETKTIPALKDYSNDSSSDSTNEEVEEKTGCSKSGTIGGVFLILLLLGTVALSVLGKKKK